jgi:hypothetical protein
MRPRNRQGLGELNILDGYQVLNPQLLSKAKQLYPSDKICLLDGENPGTPWLLLAS